MTAFWIILGLGGWVLLVISLLATTRLQRRAMLRHALRLRRSIRPYLQRRAIEAGLEVPQTQNAGVEPIVDELCTLAETLNQHERGDPAEADTVNQLAVSDTQPLVDVRRERS